jgi:hypothetical protein
VVWLLIAAASAAPCTLPAPADAPFEVPVRAERVRVVVELWVDGAPSSWTDALLATLAARGLRGMLVVPADVPTPELAAQLAAATEAGHEVAVVLPGSAVPRDVLAPVGPVRDLVAPVREAAGDAKTVVAPIGTRASEALLGKAGFNTLVDVAGAPTATPRMAGRLEGQAGVHIVLPPGPYDGACGHDPRVGPFTPAAADRAATAIQKAAVTPGTPIVRVALEGSRSDERDAAVLGRWIDEVLVPGGVTIVTAGEARLAAAKAFRSGPPEPAGQTAGGRLVSLDAVALAAGGLTTGSVVPRTLPGDLNPSEAFLAFLLVAAGRTEGNVVRLSALSGPATEATTALRGPTPISADAARTAAKALAADLPGEVPAAFSVDGRLLTAAELLQVFAGVVRGDDPIVVRPMGVPEPNERGLGWGSATLP